MARSAESWKLKWRAGPPGTCVAQVRFSFEGARYEESTGERDPREAAKRAAEIYARIVQGGGRRAAPELSPRVPLDLLVMKWVAAIRNTHTEDTRRLYEIHFSAHLVPFFKRLDRVTEARIGEYTRQRLGEVLRATVYKERATLRGFLDWCKEQAVIGAVPDFPKLPRGAVGVPSAKRKTEAMLVTPADVERFLEALPESSPGKKGGSGRFLVRPYFVALWETGLRPTTLARLSVPEHFRKGAAELVITDEIDKARWGRRLPITERARATLEAVAPSKGVIFGDHDHRDFVEKAREAAELPKGFSPYDLRHSRITDMLEGSGNLIGVAFLVGHRQVTTTNTYAKPNRAAADRVLAGLSGSVLGQKKTGGRGGSPKRRGAKEGT